MKNASYSLEFLTPCFCAGANQAVAEIRAPAIRGQLRWWFRVLGGSPADERAIFGTAAGDRGVSSSLTVRCRLLDVRPWRLPQFNPNDVESYVYYFASVSGTTTKGAKGPRWAAGAMLGPGTRIQVEFLQRRPLESRLQTALDQTVEAFLAIGSIGLRATRGLGAFHATDSASQKSVVPSEALLNRLRSAKFATERRPGSYTDDVAVAKAIGSLVKGTRTQQNWKAGKTPSPLGDSSPRQTSAIVFRPIRSEDGRGLRLFVFEAPHDRILGPSSRRSTPSVGKPSPEGLSVFTPSSRGRRY